MSAKFVRDFSRRDWIRISLASAMGVSYSRWLPELARAAEGKKQQKSCILLWMNGGPTQTDTFDPKPDHENGGQFKAIETTVPGIRISEHLPELAKQMKDMVLVRGMSSSEGDHGRGTQLMLTGYKPGQAAVQYPTLGSLISKEIGQADNELPNFVSLSGGRFNPVVNGPGFLGPQYAPLTVSGDSDNPQARANLSIENLATAPGVDKKSLKNRIGVLDFLQNNFISKVASSSAKAHRANYDRAVRMVESQAKHAFRLEQEPAELREKYGRNRFGQGCLLARRLVERGVAFVEVAFAQIPGGGNWDTHANNFARVQQLSEILDPAWSTLMDDLRERGLLNSTMIVWMGEFGRTPKINGNTGRDHFPVAWSTVLAGGGIKGGQVYGDTGKDGMQVVDEKVNVPQFYATICESLGINHAKENISSEGRPIKIVDEGGKPIRELLS